MKQACILPFRASATLFLRLSLPYLVIVSITILISYLQLRALDPIEARLSCQAWLEYLVSGIVIALGGACLIDAVERGGTR